MSVQERLRQRQAARQSPTAWPTGRAPFAVDGLLHEGRALDHAAAAGEPVDRVRAGQIVQTLAAYVNALPAHQQVETARRLVDALVLDPLLRETPALPEEW